MSLTIAEDIDIRFKKSVAATIIFQTRKMKLIHDTTVAFPNRVCMAHQGNVKSHERTVTYIRV